MHAIFLREQNAPLHYAYMFAKNNAQRHLISQDARVEKSRAEEENTETEVKRRFSRCFNLHCDGIFKWNNIRASRDDLKWAYD